MANEVINNTERLILVSVSDEGEERPLYQDYTGNFVTTDPKNISIAKSFDDLDNANKIKDTLNMLYQLTSRPEKVELVKESTQRVIVGETETQ